MTTQRSLHLRRCVGCGQMKEKAGLLRVYRKEDGTVLPDDTGRRNGRGAYLCCSLACLEKAEKSRGLERTLRCRVNGDVYEALRGRIAGLQ